MSSYTEMSSTVPLNKPIQVSYNLVKITGGSDKSAIKVSP
jgi:hypothetical protein